MKAAGIAVEAPPGIPVLSATCKAGIVLLQMSLPVPNFQLPSRLLSCRARKRLNEQHSMYQSACFQAAATRKIYARLIQDSNAG